MSLRRTTCICQSKHSSSHLYEFHCSNWLLTRQCPLLALRSMRHRFFSRFGICLLHLVYKGLAENILAALASKLGINWVEGAPVTPVIVCSLSCVALNSAIASYPWPRYPGLRKIDRILKQCKGGGWKLAYGPAVLTMSFMSISPFVMLQYGIVECLLVHILRSSSHVPTQNRSLRGRVCCVARLPRLGATSAPQLLD